MENYQQNPPLIKTLGKLQPANAAQAIEISIMVFSCDQ
jgi:hypothetical protein